MAEQFKTAFMESQEETAPYLQVNLDQDPNIDYNLLQNQQGKDLKLHLAPLYAFDTDS